MNEKEFVKSMLEDRVNIPLERFEELLRAETTLNVVSTFVNGRDNIYGLTKEETDIVKELLEME